jgi:hypothetical protein
MGFWLERPGKVCAAPYLLICGRLAPGSETEQLSLADRAIGNLQQWLIGTYHGVSRDQLRNGPPPRRPYGNRLGRGGHARWVPCRVGLG